MWPWKEDKSWMPHVTPVHLMKVWEQSLAGTQPFPWPPPLAARWSLFISQKLLIIPLQSNGLQEKGEFQACGLRNLFIFSSFYALSAGGQQSYGKTPATFLLQRWQLAGSDLNHNLLERDAQSIINRLKLWNHRCHSLEVLSWAVCALLVVFICIAACN